MFLLDDRRRLVLFNHGCCRRTGWACEEVVGQSCDYVTEADPHSRAAVLAACAPPAEVWHGQGTEVPVYLPHRTEPPRAVRMRFDPLFDAADRVAWVLGRILDPEAPATRSGPTPAQALHAELAALRHQVRSRYREETVPASSAAMRRVLSQLAAASGGSGSVLFVGEAGTGREHLARVLHNRGAHGKRAFVPVDCQRTGSSELKRMLKQLRDESRDAEPLRAGTVYLSAIGAAPRDFQERLAEWLGARPLEAAPRVMAATDQSLQVLAERDQFHRELYYLLSVLVIEVPALRQRPDDVLPLAQYFLEERNRGAECQLSGFSPEAVEAMRKYYWPGNVAELRATVDAAAERAGGPLVTLDDFPMAFRVGQEGQRHGPPPSQTVVPLERVLEQVEREQIRSALAACQENLSKAAERLGLSRPKLYRRMEALGLWPERSEG
jgi:DNA-binding NtrC family response regulator